MRSFEIGDMVLSKKNGTGFVTAFVANKTAIECEMQYNFHYYSVENGVECGFSKSTPAVIFEYDNGDKIKHIRKPRPGCKEARDIVAMFALEHRKSLNSTIALNLGSKKQIYIADKKVQSPYRKARAMLQVQS